MNTDSNISWSQRQRLEFIEMQLLFGRELNSSMLCNTFSISRYQVGNDIKLYRKICPTNLLPYKPADKHYKPSKHFKPYFISENFETPVDLSSHIVANVDNIEFVPTISRPVLDGVMSFLMAAIEHNVIIEGIYASSTSPAGKKRTLLPSSVAYVGNRVHIRAYCFVNNEYRDFVTARFKAIPKISDYKSKEPIPRDTEWAEKVEIKLVPNPILGGDGVDLISDEYQLNKIEPYLIRIPLIKYFLKSNNLPSNEQELLESKSNPWSYPLIVDNWAVISKHLINKVKVSKL